MIRGISLKFMKKKETIRITFRGGGGAVDFPHGFTLIEILLAVAIAGVLFSAVYSLLIGGLREWEQEDVKTKLIAFNSEVVVRTLEQEIREGRTITVAKDREVEFTTCSSSVPEADDDTLALWHCDEGGGTTVADSDGRAPLCVATLVALGRPAWTTSGEHNWGLDFKSTTSDSVSCGTISIISSFTLEAWIKPKGDGSEAAIIYRDSSYRLYLNSADKLVGGVYSLGWLPEVTSTESVDRSGNVWTHVALTYNQPTCRLILFIDGKIAGSVVRTATVNSVGMFIGADGLGGMFFDGIIDEIRISNVARSMKTKFSWSGTLFSQSGNYADRLIKTTEGGSYPLEEGYVSDFQLDYYRRDGRQFVPVSQSQRDQIDSVRVRLTLLQDKNRNGIEDEGEIKESLDNVIHLRN